MWAGRTQEKNRREETMEMKKTWKEHEGDLERAWRWTDLAENTMRDMDDRQEKRGKWKRRENSGRKTRKEIIGKGEPMYA